MGEWIYIHVFLILALVGGEWSASRPDRFVGNYIVMLYVIKLVQTNGEVVYVIPVQTLSLLVKMSRSPELGVCTH
jgi:hypothetical protein